MAGVELSNMATRDWKEAIRTSFRLERVRLIQGTIDDIAYPPIRWKHEDSFWNDGLRFDIWINWDGRVRIEHDGTVVLQMWPPAGEIMRAIIDRRKAHG